MRNKLRRALVSGLFGLGLVWGGAAAANAPPIADFFPDSTHHSHTLSPSGAYIANIVAQPNALDVVRVIDSSDRSELYRFTLDISTLTDLHWATDDRLLVSAKVPTKFKSGGKVIYSDIDIHRLIAIDRNGKNPLWLLDDRKYRLTTNRADISNLLPSDPAHILMQGTLGSRASLMKVNVHTGETEQVEKGAARTWGWDVDRAGQPRIRYDSASHGRYIKIKTLSEKGKWETLSTVKVEDFEALKPLAASENPREWYIANRRDGDDLSAIWLYDVTDGRYIESVRAHPEVDVDSAFVDADGAFSHAKFVTDRAQYQFQDAERAKHFKALRSFFGDDNEVDFMEISRGGRSWLLRAHGPKQPGAVFFYDMDARHAEFIDLLNPELKPEALGKVETLRYPASDGLEITAYLTHPAPLSGRTAATAPLVVMPHGGPHSRDEYGFDRLAQFLASRGYAVFQPNFRGSTGFGRAFEEAGHRQWGGTMQDDIYDGVKALRSRGLTSDAKPAIAGWSYGGYAALMSPVRHPETYRCAASINGMSDLRAMLDYDERLFGKRSEAFEAMTKMLGDKDDAAVRDMSPISHTTDYPVPVLLVAGGSDTRVSADQSRMMGKALEEAGKPVTLRVYRATNHDLRGMSPEAKETETTEDDDADYAVKAMMAELETFLAECFAQPG